MNKVGDLPRGAIATHDYNHLISVAAMGRHQRRMPFRTDRHGTWREVAVEHVQFRCLSDEAEPAGNAPVPPGNGHDNSREGLDRRLDDALTETFPASDPVSVIICARS